MKSFQSSEKVEDKNQENLSKHKDKEMEKGKRQEVCVSELFVTVTKYLKGVDLFWLTASNVTAHNQLMVFRGLWSCPPS
jgi:hypothetical protein